MNKFLKYTVTIYRTEHYDDKENVPTPIGEVSIQARDYDAAEEISLGMFSGDTWITVVENNDE